MGAIADFDQLINTLTGGTAAKELLWFFYDNRSGSAAVTAPMAGRTSSLWTYNNTFGVGLAPGGTPRNPTRTTAGALGQVNATGGRTKYLGGFIGTATQPGTFLLYDRLGDVSGLSGISTTAQTCNVNTTRYTGAASVGNQIWIEVYTIIGATPRTITCNYTNQDGNPATTPAVLIGGTGLREVTRMINVPLAVGDTGVQSVEDVTLSSSTGTAGDFGVTIVRPIALSTCALAGSSVVTDLVSQIPSLPPIETDACLSIIYFSSSATAPTFFGALSFVEA